jgi:sporulation protein YlmC with PRC-barrel domain
MATANPDRHLVSSSDVENIGIYDMTGNKIGDIDHLMIEKRSGRIRYAVISFGGFLGLGHSHYPIPWNAFSYNPARGGFETRITEQQLRDAPEFSDDSWANRDWEARVHRNYGVTGYWDEPNTMGTASQTTATASTGSELVSSEDVEGLEVYDRSGNSIGSVDHLMIEKRTGQVRYAVVSFGGFLGIGAGHHPLPWEALSYDPSLRGFRTDVTEQQLRDAPEFSDQSWASREWEQRVHEHYGRHTY